MPTIIQKAINKISELQSDCIAPDDYESGKQVAYERVITILQSLLPEEERVIRDAWKDGSFYGNIYKSDPIFRGGDIPDNNRLLQKARDEYITNLKK